MGITIEGTNKNTTSEIATGVDASTDINSLLANVADLITRTKGLDDIHDDISVVDAKVDVLEELFLPKRVVKIVTFDGGAGSGAVGTVNLFTITGGVDIDFEAFCTTNLTEAGATATIEVGIAGKTDYVIATTDAVEIDAGEVWHDATPDSTIELTSDASKEVTIYDSDIIATIGAQNVTGGVIEFSIIYTPRTSGSSLVEAA